MPHRVNDKGFAASSNTIDHPRNDSINAHFTRSGFPSQAHQYSGQFSLTRVIWPYSQETSKMTGQDSQEIRFEHTYSLPPSTAANIEKFLEVYVLEDEFYLNGQQDGYSVCSLYLEDIGFQLYEEKQVWLRIRFYNDDPKDEVFLELKRRDNNQRIRKHRVAVIRRGAHAFLSGMTPAESFLVGKEASDNSPEALDDFCRVRDEMGLKNLFYLTFRRRAFHSPKDSRVRVTFDYQHTAGRYYSRSEFMIPPTVIPHANKSQSAVILKLRSSDQKPSWITELRDIFGLLEISSD